MFISKFIVNVERILYKFEFLLSMAGYLPLSHYFSVISDNITINHMLPKSRFFGIHICHRQHCDLIVPESCRKLQNSVKWCKMIAIMPFEVTNLISIESAYASSCTNSSNLPHVLHCFRDMADD